MRPRRPLPLGLLVIVASLIGVLSAQGGDRPAHYFTGRVCAGKDDAVVKPGAHDCETPLESVKVTIRNSKGQTASTHTDSNGLYALAPTPLFGTDDDLIAFESKDFVAFKIIGLTDVSKPPEKPELGATILLPQPRTVRVKSVRE